MMLLVLLLGSNMPLATTQCPNMCSGNGDCGADNVCQCYDGYDFAADCSMRAFWANCGDSPPFLLAMTGCETAFTGTCPYGVAWADKAYALDKAHTSAECSNAGICERSSGICTCFEGYTGIACQRCAFPPARILRDKTWRGGRGVWIRCSCRRDLVTGQSEWSSASQSPASPSPRAPESRPTSYMPERL